MTKRLKLEYMDVDQLMPLEGNPRKLIDEDGVAKLKKLIAKHGFQNPLQVYKEKNGRYSILCGNHRFEAGIAIGLKEFPCFVYTGSREMATARAISDNKSSNWTDWELPLLKDSLAELDTGDFDIELTGWTESEIAEMFDYGEVAELEGEDSVPDAPEEAITQVGDLYQLGEHRLLCGDSTAQSSVETLMDGQKADMVFTDPPYGMNLDTDFSGMKGIRQGKKYKAVEGDSHDYDPAHIFEHFGKCKEIFLWGADYYSERIPDRNVGSWIVWDKRGGGKGCNDNYDKMFGSNFELCWSKARHKRALARVLWKGIFGLSKEDTKKRVHPTQKPVELVEWFLTKYGDGSVVDLFGGSGSTIIACEKLNRKCYMMEIDPKYCDVIVERYKNLFPDQTVKLLNREEELTVV